MCVSTSTMASGASAGTHGYADNIHDWGWRLGSYSTARQRHITNAVRGVRASRGWSASTPRKAVSDSRVSGWGSGRGHHSAVQTASPYRRRQSCHHEQTRSSGPIDLVHARYWTFKDDNTGPAIGTASTFGRPRRGDFEGSSCNTAAGVSFGGKTGQPPAPRGPGRPGLTCSHVCAMELVKKKGVAFLTVLLAQVESGSHLHQDSKVDFWGPPHHLFGLARKSFKA